jgi:hypothetical protein
MNPPALLRDVLHHWARSPKSAPYRAAHIQVGHASVVPAWYGRMQLSRPPRRGDQSGPLPASATKTHSRSPVIIQDQSSPKPCWFSKQPVGDFDRTLVTTDLESSPR